MIIFAWLFLSFKLDLILANISVYVNYSQSVLHVICTTFMMWATRLIIHGGSIFRCNIVYFLSGMII